MTKEKVKVFFILMEICMKEIGRITYQMVKEFFIILMETGKKEVG